ncbi:MAG: hypothetical protein AAF670_08690 [Planctomycetota bacterium]
MAIADGPAKEDQTCTFGPTHAVACGGIAMIMSLIKTIGVNHRLNTETNVFKLHLPFDEAEHLLNIAPNAIAGILAKNIEQRRQDGGNQW